MHAVPAHYFAPDVKKVPDEHFAAAPGKGTADDPFWVDDDEPAASGAAATGPFTFRTTRMRSPAATPSSANPPNGSKQKFKPKRILFGNWVRSGLYAGQSSNAVYGFRDILNRINRKIAKMDVAGRIVLGGIYNVKKIFCKHDDIEYLPIFRGMTKQKVNAHIQPLLDAMETGGEKFETEPSFPNRLAAEKRVVRQVQTVNNGGGGVPNPGGALLRRRK